MLAKHFKMWPIPQWDVYFQMAVLNTLEDIHCTWGPKNSLHQIIIVHRPPSQVMDITREDMHNAAKFISICYMRAIREMDVDQIPDYRPPPALRKRLNHPNTNSKGG